jgi:lipid A 3-O-deacylase
MVRKTTILFMLIGCLALPALAESPAQAPGSSRIEGWVHDIRLGVLAHDVDNLWSGRRKEEGIDYNAEIVFNTTLAQVLSGKIRPNAGLSINDRGDTSKLYGGILWAWQTPSVFFNIGLGAAWHNGELETSDPDKKSLGSRVLFRIPFEVGLTLHGPHRLSVMFDHVSNGYLASPNEGLDTLGLRYSYVFAAD